MGIIVPKMAQSKPISPVDPNDLLIFAHVVELGSFSRAADRLQVPKSTVSRRLLSLEQQLGERLLLRTTRRQTVTEFGAQLLDHARQVAQEVQAVSALREQRQSAPSGRLRVSMPSEFANLLLTDALAAFTKLYPGITLELDLSARRVDLLGEGFDLAVRVGRLPDDNLLAARHLNEFSIGLYAASSYLAERGKPQAPNELTNHDCVSLLGSDGAPAPWRLMRGSEQWDLMPSGRIVANSPELLMALVKVGAGIAAVPDYFAQAAVRSGVLQRILNDWCLPSQTASAVFPGRKLMPAKTRVFIDMLQTALGPMPTILPRTTGGYAATT